MRRIASSGGGVGTRGSLPAPIDADNEPLGKRRMKRRPLALPGIITFRHMRLQVPCTIADLSITGARLAVMPSGTSQLGDLNHLPDEIILIMRLDRMQVTCTVQWRQGTQLGVRFLGPPTPLSMVSNQ